MSLDMTSFAAMIKTRYTDEVVEDLTYQRNPFLALVAKNEDFGGDSLVIPVIYEDPQNNSATFSSAQNGSSTTSSAKFAITAVKEYGFAYVDGRTALASKGRENAFMDAVTTEFDKAFHSVGRRLAIAMYRSGWGDIGVIAAGGVSGSTLTLATASD